MLFNLSFEDTSNSRMECRFPSLLTYNTFTASWNAKEYLLNIIIANVQR